MTSMTSALVEVTTPVLAQRRGRDLGAGRGRDPGLGPALRSGGHDLGPALRSGGPDLGLGPTPRSRGRGRDLVAGRGRDLGHRGHDPGLGSAPRLGDNSIADLSWAAGIPSSLLENTGKEFQIKLEFLLERNSSLTEIPFQ
nr:hypothetical protein Iba_chr12cCG16370 [Ipomoea batatas]